MSFGAAGRLVLAVVVLAIGHLACTSVTPDKAKALTLPKALAEVKLFAGLTDAERNALRPAATLRRATAGERIIEQGKALDKMFIILRSQAEVRVNGKRVLTLTGQPLVGEIEFLDMRPACADVLLLKDTDLIEVDCAALNALMEKHPRLGYVLMREIARIEARRLRETNSR